MKIELTSDQEKAVDAAIECGRLRAPEEAGREAMALWEEREHRRATILASLDDAEASDARGESLIITRESINALAKDLMDRHRHRFSAEPSSND